MDGFGECTRLLNIAKQLGLPVPRATPLFIHCDVYASGIPVVSQTVDLIISQHTISKWNIYPTSSNETLLGFTGTMAAEGMRLLGREVTRVLRTGGMALLHVSVTDAKNELVLQSAEQRPPIDGTMLPLVLAFGTEVGTVPAERRAQRVTQFARVSGSSATIFQEPSPLNHIRVGPT